MFICILYTSLWLKIVLMKNKLPNKVNKSNIFQFKITVYHRIVHWGIEIYFMVTCIFKLNKIRTKSVISLDKINIFYD